MNTFFRHIVCLSCIMMLIHCGQAGTRVGNPPTTTTITTSALVYPSNFAISSALQTSSSTQNLSHLVAAESYYLTDFSSTISAIDNILAGADITDCSFDPAPLLLNSVNANCYGPNIDFINHPDNTQFPNSGQLPSGDVGLWTDQEIDSSEACSAAQQKALIGGVAQKSNVLLKALASMVCVANVNEITLPETAQTLDLQSEMNAMLTSTGNTNLQFNVATLSLSVDHASSNNIYSYDLQFSYTDETGVHNISTTMQHMPLETTEALSTYQGKFSYKYDLDSVLKCNNEGFDTSTIAGSVAYNKSSNTALAFKADWAYFCDEAANIDPFSSNGLLDPSLTYAPATPNGWLDNYSLFLANINTSTLAGDYAYAWQAGTLDSHSRVFNLKITGASTESLAGEAFYGYGADVNASTFDGRILGFICNWAGPNNTHTLQNLVQHQFITQSGELFIVDTDVANPSRLSYAPTNSCSYTAPSNPNEQFTFNYDSDGDSVIDTNDKTQDLTHNLQSATDSDTDGLLDVIHDEAGFTLPSVTIF